MIFLSTNLNGRVYGCDFGDNVLVNFNVTPTTQKIYSLDTYITTNMNCDEMLSFINSTFTNSRNYHVYFDKNTSNYRCDAWEWDVSDNYVLKVTPYDNGVSNRFEISITDPAIIKDNEVQFELQRRNSVSTPKL